MIYCVPVVGRTQADGRRGNAGGTPVTNVILDRMMLAAAEEMEDLHR